MEEVKSRKFFICVLAVVVSYTFILADNVKFMKYNYYADYQCLPEDTLFQSDNVFDAFTCGKLCHESKKCRSFSYQPDADKCIGCRVDIFAFAARSQIVPGTMLFSNAVLEKDCDQIKKKNPNATSGVYKIKLWQSNSEIDVYCDMDNTAGRGWTVIQNRFDGSVNFYRDCKDYENGFGDISGEYWLGLKYIQEITDGFGNSYLRIVLSRQNGNTGFETIKQFHIKEGRNYTLTPYVTRSDISEHHSGIKKMPETMSYGTAPFSCKNKDMEQMVAHCAAETHGAWWHEACSVVNLNGEYCTPGQVCDDGKNGITGFYHRGFAGYESLKTSRMMILSWL